jgi:hypothetical protein
MPAHAGIAPAINLCGSAACPVCVRSGCRRLIELCESSLVAELLRLPLPAAAAEAPHLLCLADELGLSQLRRAAVAFIAQHYTEVQVRLQAGLMLLSAGCVRTCSTHRESL